MPVLTIKTAAGDRYIEFAPGRSVREVLDSTSHRVRSGCRGTGACGLCRVRATGAPLAEPTLAERLYLPSDQIERGVRLACQVRPGCDLEVVVLNPAPVSIWRTWTPDESCGSQRLPFAPPPGLPADVKDPCGVAVDLGTTHISCSFHHLTTGERITGRKGLNPQSEYGADVVTRLNAACESPDAARALRWQAIEAIGGAIADVALREGLGPERVVRVVLGGNTAMLALLSGRNIPLLLQPAHWMSRIDCLPRNVAEFAAAWGIHPEADIEILPPLAGFVGSDLLAGVLATELTETGAGSLFIDFGTNSEIALWDGETLWVTAAAGGPAFEGCGFSCGSPAEPGAIYRVRISGEPKRENYTGAVTSLELSPGLCLEFTTIGGEAPTGFCGSGIVDLISCLVRAGKLTDMGRFSPDMPRSGLPLLDGEPRLVLTKNDVDVFQRAKGAICAAIRILLSKAGMESSHVARIFVGGSFGHFLSRTDAMSVGLLPVMPAESVHVCGNTSLAGCERLLGSPDPADTVASVASGAKIVNLSRESDFPDLFLEGLYLSSWPR